MPGPILVATDFTHASEAAERRAASVASAMGAPLLLFHAIEALEDDNEAVRSFYAALEARAREQLEERAAKLRKAGHECTVAVEVGRRWECIVTRAAREEAELVVIGARQAYRPGEPYLGATSLQVFLTCRRPLLVVRDDTAVEA